MAAEDISGVRIPDSKLAREVTQRIRDAEGDLLFYHSTRVYFWGALIAKRKDLIFDPELLYTAAMFHALHRSHVPRDRPYPKLPRKPASLRSGWRECRA